MVTGLASSFVDTTATIGSVCHQIFSDRVQTVGMDLRATSLRSMSTQSNSIFRIASFSLAAFGLSCICNAQTESLPEKKAPPKIATEPVKCESEVLPIKRAKKPAKPDAADWTTMASTYTHDQHGQRVDQYAMAVEPQSNERADFVKSGFRSSRSSLQVGFSADHYHTTEQWGQPVRPYGEWRYPNRPFSVPYGQWGPQLPQVVVGGNQWNAIVPRAFNPGMVNPALGQAGQMANPNGNANGLGIVNGIGNAQLAPNGNGGWSGNGNANQGWGQNNGMANGFGVGPGNALQAGQDEYYQQAPTYFPPTSGFQSPFKN